MRINSCYNNYYGVVSREATPIVPILFAEQSDDLISEIFAPDPLTGFPTNALSLVLNKGVAAEVQQFIKDNLLTVHPPKGGAPDDETAEATMRLNSEQYGTEIDGYYSRLSEFVQSVSNEINEVSE